MSKYLKIPEFEWDNSILEKHVVVSIVCFIRICSSQVR